MNELVEGIREMCNTTQTLNGDLAFLSTTNANLDFFSSVGGWRNTAEDEIRNRFQFAYCENANIALKNLLYARDISNGLGERRVFRTCFSYLIFKQDVKSISAIIETFISQHIGRWDDLLLYPNWIQHRELFNRLVVPVITEQLEKDMDSEYPSLLAKWMPSENTSSKMTIKMAKFIINELGWSPKKYRKTLSSIRKKINLVETMLTEKRISDIDYSKVPSKCHSIHSKYFTKYDSDRYNEYINAVQNGTKKINSKDLYPYELVEKILNSEENSKAIQAMWDNLPDYTQDENALVMADVSGSMSGRPMAISVSLAIYFAERNNGMFKNVFMTFTDIPQLIELPSEMDLYNKVYSVLKHEGFNTDVDKAFDVILEAAKKYNITQEQMPKKLYIISDMQFDNISISGLDETMFQRQKRKYEEAGYTLPLVVFWNCNELAVNRPVLKDTIGTALISGSSPTSFRLAMNLSSTPLEIMINALKDRYPIIDKYYPLI